MSKATPATTTPQPDAASAPVAAFDAAAWIEKMKAWRNPFGWCENSELWHPDQELLELVGQTLAFEKATAAIYQEEFTSSHPSRIREVETNLRTILRRASKLHATTPAGIFAKVLLVRKSKTGAAILARSLAADMAEQPGLRRLFWPAEVL